MGAEPTAAPAPALPAELPPALAPYLRRGWPILPLLPGAKAPAGRLVPAGVDDATADPIIATAWWLSLPTAGVGVALAPAGLLVIGPDSPAWLAEFERLGLPPTAVAESRPGHRHYYYRRPDGCRLHRLCKAGAYNILTNGYVVAPPSIHPETGQPYRWLTPPDALPALPDAPGWAVEWLTTGRGGKCGSGEAGKRGSRRAGEPGSLEAGKWGSGDEGASSSPPPHFPASPLVPSSVPPVRLPPVLAVWWRGERVVHRPGGQVDRSETLYAIAIAVLSGGASPDVAAASLAERDRTLGYRKYSDRPDGGAREYERIVAKALPVVEHNRALARAMDMERGRRGRVSGEAALTSAPPHPLTPSPILPAATFVRLSEVRPERVGWLWPGRLPLVKLVVLDGDPGLGKTTLLLDLAARLSRGAPLPDGAAGVQGATILLSAEDGLADTLRPRVDAAGGDPARVLAFTEVADGEARRAPELPRDLPLLEDCIVAEGARLVFIDPLVAFLATKTNTQVDQEVRRALAPLARTAERTGATIVAIRHLNKDPSGKALYRGGGSIGIIAASRVGLLLAAHPDDPARRVLAISKNNLAAPVPSLAYRLEPAGDGGARIVWEGPVDYTADALLTAAIAPTQPAPGPGDQAAAFLKAALAGGRRPAADVWAEARTAGIAEATVKRAKRALGVVVRRVQVGPEAAWFWELPTAPPARAGQGDQGDQGDHPGA